MLVGVDPVEALSAALDTHWAVGRTVSVADLGRPTPCPGWSVSDVLNHSVGVIVKFTRFASGTTDHPRTPGGELLGDDHVGALRSATESARSAWKSVDRSRRCTLPFGTFPADLAAGVNLVDTLAHSWDLSVASGLPLECDDQLWLAGLEAAAGFIGPRRDPAQYAPEVAVSLSASPKARFLGYLGRRAPWPS
jgi:uncharacterized protein (TIGR03086 family)